MMGLDDVLAQVETAYRRLGLPTWPSPRPPMASPRDDEYTRVTDPERYRIVHARARVWAEALTRLPGLTATSLPPAPLDAEGHRGTFARGVRLTAARPGTLPLLLLERDAPLTEQEGSLAVLHVCVVRPEVSIAVLPDCGCDACDQGSDDLLGAIDQTIGRLVAGSFVVLRGRGWVAEWYPDGGRSGGDGAGPDHGRVMAWARRLAEGGEARLPEGTEAFVGRSWLA